MVAGHQSDYTFASSEDGSDGYGRMVTGDVDTVTNVETLSFDDGDIGVSGDNDLIDGRLGEAVLMSWTVVWF